MIHALLQYAQDRGITSRPGYAKKKVKWVLDFSEDGSRFLGLLSSDREFASAPDLSQPELVAFGSQREKAARSKQTLSDGKPKKRPPKEEQASHFLVAPLGVFLGWAKDAKEEPKEKKKRDAHVWLLEQASCVDVRLGNLAKSISDGRVSEEMRKAALSIKPTPKPSDLATVRLGGQFPADQDGWHSWWDGFRSSLKPRATASPRMACFGTGELVIPENTHPKVTQLKGVGLSQPHAPIVTFDKDAFASYGLTQAANAAMGAETAKAYVTAIDRLLEDSVIFGWRRPKKNASYQLEKEPIRIAGTRISYWYTGPAPARNEVESELDIIAADFGDMRHDPPPTDDHEQDRKLAETRLRRMIDRIRSGDTVAPVGEVRFCILALSGAGGRVMMRDFFEGSVLQLADATDHWLSDLSLVTWQEEPGKNPSLEQVLTAPLPLRKHDQDYLEWVKPTGTWRQAMWRAALLGGSLPQTAISRSLAAHNAAVVRGDLFDEKICFITRSVSRLRLALAKAYLIRKGIPMQPALDPEHPSAAYHCGRLLAIYDALQRAALGDVGAGVIQRYYGGALTNPSGVFGQLSRMAQTHLSKLGGGLAHNYEERIAEIHNGIRGDTDSHAAYPSALGLDDQALFALGFWHQTASTNQKKAENSAAKKAREANAQNPTTTQEEN